MKILLVAPKNPESFWTFDRILPLLGVQCIYPNLALPTLAALTPREHAVVLCDENVEAIDFDCDADIVGITGYIVHGERMRAIAAEFRRRGVTVVAGGPYASLCPNDLRDAVDAVFVDEAEESWPRFLRDYADGTWQREYRQAEKTDMAAAPLPRFDLLRVEAYQTMAIQFGRGCPYTCEFCDIIVMYGRRPRTKTAAQVLREVEEVHRLGASTVFVVDDNFIADKPRARSLLRALAAWQNEHGTPLEFMTEVSLNVAQDRELLELLRSANFRSVFIGIESPRPASLRETRKVQNLREDLVAAVHRIQAAGIEVMAGMIVGFDHDDAAIFDEHLQFLEAARIPVSMTGMLNALPRTPLYERLAAADRLDERCRGDQFAFTNIVPLRMSRAELFAGYRRLLRELYDEPAYYRRAMAFLRARGGGPAPAALPSRRELRALSRTLWSCIVTAPPRRARMAARLLLATALRRPSQLPTAVALTALHKHFREFVDEITTQLDAVVRDLTATNRLDRDTKSVCTGRADAGHSGGRSCMRSMKLISTRRSDGCASGGASSGSPP